MLAWKAGEVAGRGVRGHQETFTDPSGELPGAGQSGWATGGGGSGMESACALT